MFFYFENVCLQDGCLPSSQKKALVTPALKKASLDPDTLKNYRPISNFIIIIIIIIKEKIKVT